MSNSAYRILIVDDEKDITEFLGYNLKREGFEVIVAHDGFRALELAREQIPQLVLLDVMMPGMDGIETCHKLRELPELQNTAIAFLTARAEDYSQIAGFEAGGDDYITKPVRPRVLVSRIRALLKRYSLTAESEYGSGLPVIDFGWLNIDRERYVVSIHEKEIILPRKEFNLLVLLTSKPGRVFTRDEIYHGVWGEYVNVGERTIDVYIRKLREKLGIDCIRTIKGVGYKFEKSAEGINADTE